MTRSDKWKKRPAVVKYWEFKDIIVQKCKEYNFELGNNYKITYTIEMPESWSKKKKDSMFNQPHQAKPDLDNLNKSINDCLKENDQSVYHTDAYKFWGYYNSIQIQNL
jgi:Holliday junction resolvase RusA-like endonuclease